ncbi:MAG TPA: cytochrome c [Novosphingobium sp.]|nr:cytochrome c [Novosphingobium sp.]
MSSKFTIVTRAVIGVAALAGVSAAFAASPADVVTARQHDLKGIGGHTKAIFDELKKPTPAVDVIRTHAHAIALEAPKLPGWFPAGTGPQAGIKTHALPAIWSQPADFRKAADNFAAQSKALDAAAATGDLAKIKPAAGQLGGACKQCHDTFREKQ